MALLDHRHIVELVDAALDLPPAARQNFLDSECAGQPELRAEVDSLLAEDIASSDDFLDVPAALQAVDMIAATDGDPVGGGFTYDGAASGDAAAQPAFIGPYRVLKELGRGGMGTVFLAEQREPIERRIALKVIHGFEGERGTRRFAAECRALARLKHPNIAAVYDAGVTDDGRAFVAMEWVEGTHITDWCDLHRLSLSERLELFLGVCAGVGHAHQKGLVHRDLKPSNVLVSEVDGKAVAKVIDFGIARTLDADQGAGLEDLALSPGLMDSPSPQDPAATIIYPQSQSQSLLVGSPLYMSPEAASFKDRTDVDTRTDVYSLGILLYELLIGEAPFESSGLGLRALLRQRQMTDSPTLSQRWSGFEGDERSRLAGLRSVTPGAVARRLRGDLDAILNKATARKREERYDSVSDFAADLGRHLENRPVQARTRSFGYNLARFARRNLGAVVAVALVIGALSAGVVARTQEARRANQEAEKAHQALAEAEQLSDFLIGLFEVADPDRRGDDPESVDELLAKAESSMDEELADQPLAQARFLQTLGRVALNRTEYDRAAASYERALDLQEKHGEPGDPELITTVGSLGVVYRRQGRLDDAEALLIRAIDLVESADPQHPSQISAVVTWLANLHYTQTRYDEAIAGHRRALEIRLRQENRNPGAIGESYNNLGVALRVNGRYAEAKNSLRQAETLFIEGLGEDHPLVVGCWLNLAGIEEQLGDWPEAERLLKKAAAAWTEIYGPTHYRTLLA
ncbi:MAG: serine/threonine-protein kinase, partial [Acidobacteriota bacterium]